MTKKFPSDALHCTAVNDDGKPCKRRGYRWSIKGKSTGQTLCSQHFLLWQRSHK